jgi:hypothetical protein
MARASPESIKSLRYAAIRIGNTGWTSGGAANPYHSEVLL